MGCCVQQFCWKREESKTKERRVEGPVAKERKRRIYCQEPLLGASQVTRRNSFVSGDDRSETSRDVYVLSGAD